MAGESAAYRLFNVASFNSAFSRRPECDHLAQGIDGYWCLCRRRTGPRCERCHTDHLLSICPVCETRELDPDVHHVIRHEYPPGDRLVTFSIGKRIVHGQICAGCAIDTTSPNCRGRSGS